MTGWHKIAWKPLGTGRQAPAGSIPSRKLAQKIADYKTRVAGRYRSLSPQDIPRLSGDMILSPKIDGETWFLYSKKGNAWLLSPSGKIITDIPATDEAKNIINDRQLLLAGELYAINGAERPRVYDLHSALGGGENAKTDNLRFDAFDLLEENRVNFQRQPFCKRINRLRKLLGKGNYCHSVSFEAVNGSSKVMDAYRRLVTEQGQEGIVIRSVDGGIIKIKPEITIDTAVVGFTQKARGGIAEILLAMIRPDGKYQLIGRVNTGFSEAERFELSGKLTPLAAPSDYMASSRRGALFYFVRPETVVEIKCNDLLAVRSNGRSIKRMALEYCQDGWQAIRSMPAVSMINAVFRRIREDKTVSVDSIRFSQVTDLVPVEMGETQQINLPVSTILRREVLTKTASGKLCVRKAVVWKTNKEKVDQLYPPYVVFFTDYSPNRENPIKTDIRISSSLDKINEIAEAWLKDHRTQGWNHRDKNKSQASFFPNSRQKGDSFHMNMGIAFTRSSSVNFPIAVSRIKSLARTGKLNVENDDKGRPLLYEVILEQEQLVENVRKIQNLLKIIGTWKGAEFVLNGDPLGLHDLNHLLEKLDIIANCWRRQKRTRQPCRNSFFMGCDYLKFDPSSNFPGTTIGDSGWYAVGQFEENKVSIDKENMLEQINSWKNEHLMLCPLYEQDKIRQRIEDLPQILDPEKDAKRWVMGYHVESGKPAWVFPKDHNYLPYGITTRLVEREKTDDVIPGISPSQNTGIGFGAQIGESEERNISQRIIPQTRYTDVCGQDVAVEQVRDYAELPLKYADMFKQVGVKPGKGILLHGPPGNGKTLLARAVAGESGAHVETISGPELLSKWVGESESNLRDVFERAAHYAPSVIIMDEVDSLAGNRESDGMGYLRQVVSQLLVLMDGLSNRGRVLIIATTNCPDHIDSAIMRPGRIDRKIFMGLPDKQGRIVLWEKLLSRMSVDEGISLGTLADMTGSFSEAEIEHIANEAGLLVVKEAIKNQIPTESLRISQDHFIRSINHIRRSRQISPQTKTIHQPTTILSPFQLLAPAIL